MAYVYYTAEDGSTHLCHRDAGEMSTTTRIQLNKKITENRRRAKEKKDENDYKRKKIIDEIKSFTNNFTNVEKVGTNQYRIKIYKSNGNYRDIDQYLYFKYNSTTSSLSELENARNTIYKAQHGIDYDF